MYEGNEVASSNNVVKAQSATWRGADSRVHLESRLYLALIRFSKFLQMAMMNDDDVFCVDDERRWWVRIVYKDI